MKTEIENSHLAMMADALAILSSKLEAKDIRPGADAIVARMKLENWAMQFTLVTISLPTVRFTGFKIGF